LKNVFVKLDRAFGVRFECENNSLENRKIKAYFKDESLWSIIQVLKSATNYNYRIMSDSGEIKEVMFYK